MPPVSMPLFSTHHCIHKATLLRTGPRDVTVLLLQPTVGWTKDDRQQYGLNFG